MNYYKILRDINIYFLLLSDHDKYKIYHLPKNGYLK